MAIFVSDLDEAIHLWRDVMGFELILKKLLPDGPKADPKTYIYPELLDDIFKVKGALSEMAILRSTEGALIELQHCKVPAIKKTDPEALRYGHTGFHELGLLVENIDSFFEKIKEAGYQTQTDYIWKCADIGRSFLFYDQDGNMIQIWQNPEPTQPKESQPED